MTRHLGWAVMLGLSIGLIAPAVRADVPPPDQCMTEGASCDNAGPDADGSGTCAKRTCTRGSPTGEVTEYECLRCVPGSSSKKDDDDDGCSMGPVRTEHGIVGVLALVGLAALRLGRRR
ncbi:MAG: hypothetical protein M3020_28490 [Myxococcota bacterium]|nr:hypothetical protein [Myxococcota bacterium]